MGIARKKRVVHVEKDGPHPFFTQIVNGVYRRNATEITIGSEARQSQSLQVLGDSGLMLFVGFLLNAYSVVPWSFVQKMKIIVAVIIRRGAHSLQAIKARRADGRRRQPSIGVSAVRRIRLDLLRRRVVADLVGGGPASDCKKPNVSLLLEERRL